MLNQHDRQYRQCALQFDEDTSKENFDDPNLKLFPLSFFMLQCLAVFTPLIVILVFSILKKSEHGDWKEATLGSEATQRFNSLCISYSKFRVFSALTGLWFLSASPSSCESDSGAEWRVHQRHQTRCREVKMTRSW